MSIIKYLDEWITRRSSRQTYCEFLDTWQHNGEFMRLGFFCIEDVEPFK